MREVEINVGCEEVNMKESVFLRIFYFLSAFSLLSLFPSSLPVATTPQRSVGQRAHFLLQHEAPSHPVTGEIGNQSRVFTPCLFPGWGVPRFSRPGHAMFSLHWKGRNGEVCEYTVSCLCSISAGCDQSSLWLL